MNLAKILNVYLGYALMVVLVIYLVTGWALTGTFGLNSIIDGGTSHSFHYSLPLAIALVALAVLHGLGKYLVRLKNRKPKQPGPAQQQTQPAAQPQTQPAQQTPEEQPAQ